MEIKNIRRGRTTTTVVLFAASRDQALCNAMTATGESRESLFGWDASEDRDDPGMWTVSLHTD